MENYEYDHEALINYLSSVMQGSIPVNLITDLLGKKGRYREKGNYYNFDEHPHIDLLTEYLIERVNG